MAEFSISDNETFDHFGEEMSDGRLVEPATPKPFRLREAILLSKKLGRPLTEFQMKQLKML